MQQNVRKLREKLPPVRQLQDIFEHESDENIVISPRTDKPNMGYEELAFVVRSLVTGMNPSQLYRLTELDLDEGDKYFGRARDDLYHILRFIRLGTGPAKRYYLKFFFFDRKELKGVYFISAREVGPDYQL